MQVNKIVSPVEAFLATDEAEAGVAHVSSFVLEKGLLVRERGGHLLPNTPIDPADTLPEFEGWPSKLKLLFGDVTAYSNWARPEPEPDEQPWRAMAIQQWGILHRRTDSEPRALRSFLGNALSAMHFYSEVYVQRLDNRPSGRPIPRLTLRAVQHPPLVQFSKAPGSPLEAIYPDTPNWQRAARFLQRLSDVAFDDDDFSQPNDSPFNN